MPRNRLQETPPRLWPRFGSSLHSPAVAARVGRVLGICFGICFVTGMLSYYQYHPWRWLPVPAAPAWGYRLTQGVHVITGIATIPLLLVKLWSVYPKLFQWPPVRSALHAMERLSIAVLVSASLVEVVTGFCNILDWYPWNWSFVLVHRELGYVVIGSLLVHIAVKLPVIRSALAAPLGAGEVLAAPAAGGPGAPLGAGGPGAPPGAGGKQATGLSRRGLLAATAVGVGTVVATTVGQSFTPLEPIALLAPRRPSSGPLGVPVNKTARQAGVTRAATAPSYRLSVLGSRSFDLDLAALEAEPTVSHRFPLACVEGWSVSAHWRGLSLLDLVRRAGGDANSRVLVRSLQPDGPYRTSYLEGPQLARAILATHLNGQRITLDHGYPVRLIAPNRAGVLNTKWLSAVEIG